MPQPETSAAASSSESAPHFRRTIGTWSAVAINMTQMCGIGPFVTIPLVVAAMGGPQAMLAWVLGAVLVMADGLVWAELGAAMPGAGGTYLYLREAFQYRTGRLMPFLFIWTAILAIPLIMSTGVIGLLKYLEYYGLNLIWTPATNSVADATAAAVPAPDAATTASAAASTPASLIAVTPWGAILAILIVTVVVISLYRNIGAIKKLTVALWIIMFISVCGVMAASFTHFDPALAFQFPKDAFKLTPAFFAGLGTALVLAVYDYLGYNTTAYMGAELKNPGRVMPRSIIFSIAGMMVIYLVMNIGILGVAQWQEVKDSNYVASTVVEHNWGRQPAYFLTALIIVTAFASVFTGLLGGSRVPFNAARDKLFFPVFGRLHPRLNFPHVSLVVMGVITAIGSLFSLTDVINMLTAVTVLIQAIAQIVALFVLRKRQPNLSRPYRMSLYPLPAIVALAGWLFVYVASGWPMLLDDSSIKGLNGSDYWLAILKTPGTLSLAWILLGFIAFLFWARVEKVWPFGPREIREEFLHGAC